MTNSETVAVRVEIQPYDRQHGVISWHDRDEEISVKVTADGAVTIRANAQGLLGLARELLTLRQDAVPNGSEVFLM
jgi:uncharacterized protein YggU (UPF0235/DUF167 family)